MKTMATGVFKFNLLLLWLQIGCVDRFVRHVNSTLRQQHEEERLQKIVDKIEPYDAIEAPNDECLKVSVFDLEYISEATIFSF